MNRKPPHRNQLWAQALVSELARGGVDHVALSPGSRSAPLAVAFHEHPRITVSVHPDERSGAFYALGRAKASGRPVATLTTSGSAVANQHPAVVEAYHSMVPLLVVSADRPPHLQEVGANQTIDQAGIFRRHTNWSHSLGLPLPEAKALRHLRAVAGRALGRARGPPAGPVHLNVPFDEPLSPDPVPGDVPEDLLEDPDGGSGRSDYLPWLAAVQPARWPDPGLVGMLTDRFVGRPGVIVAGPRHMEDAFPAALLSLARTLGAPVIADPLSGVRFVHGTGGSVMGGADAFLSVEAVRSTLRPEWVLQFGAPPTSKQVLRWLEQHPQAFRVVVDESGRHPDPVATSWVSAVADASRFCVMLDKRAKQVLGGDEAPPENSDWLRGFLRLDAHAKQVLASFGEWEATLPRRVLSGLTDEGLLFIGSSLPVRDLDRYAPPFGGRRRVIGNRGVSGIDGSVASAVGAAAAHGGPAAAVVGDIALTHDQGSLALLRRQAPRLSLFVVRNGGGAIFGELPIARHDPPLSELFLTNPEWDLAKLAEGHGVRHRLMGEQEDLALVLKEDPGGVVEVAVDREASHARREQVVKALEKRLPDVLEKAPTHA